MNIAFILNEPYPVGMACSKRVHLYAKGLEKQGDDVSIVIPRAKGTKRQKNTALEGVHDGIKYYHTSGSTFRNKNLFIRKWNDFFGPITAFLLLKKKRPDKIILISGLLYHIFLYKILAQVLKVVLIREKSEIPYYWKEKLYLHQKLKLKIIFSFFNGMIVISEELANFFKNDLKIKARVIIIPIIQEFNHENNKPPVITKHRNILYSGSLLERKDGVISILKTISEIRKEFNNVKLIITGNAKSSPDYILVKKTINDLNLSDNIEFTGFIAQGKLDTLTREAGILISAKPINRQNHYNFPTKLGEYLSSGVPVLSTETPVVKKFFTDKENIFFTAQDPISIANNIKFIFSNYDLARKIGMAGKVIAMQNFDYLNHTKRLRKFLINETLIEGFNTKHNPSAKGND